MEKLDEFDDAVFAFSDLKEDFVYARIPRERRFYYIVRSMEAGRKAADEFRGTDLPEILRADGVTVRYCSGAVASGLHSQICYDGKTKQIDVFLKTAEDICRAMQNSPYPVAQDQVVALFLAHEFYHFIEYSQHRYTDELCGPVQTRLLGLWKQTLKVRRTSEIAAFLFSKEFCRFPIHPKLLDYALLVQGKGQGFDAVPPRIERLKEEYQAECPIPQDRQSKEEQI